MVVSSRRGHREAALSGRERLTIGVAFCLSGAAALIYQVAWQRIRVFELSSPQQTLLRRVSPRDRMGWLRSFLHDPRVEITIDDGRNRLLRERTLYDIIEADPLLPVVAGSGNVYSVEFFRLVAERLKPGGIASSWGPTPRVVASFSAAFPYVFAARGTNILLGSNHRLPLRPEPVAGSRQLPRRAPLHRSLPSRGPGADAPARPATAAGRDPEGAAQRGPLPARRVRGSLVGEPTAAESGRPTPRCGGRPGSVAALR